MYHNVLKDYSDKMKEILRLIMESDGITRGELIELSGLSVITLTKYVTRFMDDGVAVESGSSASTGGRRAALSPVRSRRRRG